MRQPWITSRAGFRGPQHVVRLVELEIESHLAAEREGIALSDYSSALVSALTLTELARRGWDWMKSAAPAWLPVRRTTRLSPRWYF